MSRIPALIMTIIGVIILILSFKIPNYSIPLLCGGIIITGQSLFSFANLAELMNHKKYIFVLISFVPLIIGLTISTIFGKNFALFITGLIIEAIGPVILSKIFCEL